MKHLSKRLLAVLMVLVMAMGMSPYTASAADQFVNLNTDPVSAIQTAINTAASGGGIVTVTGTANATATLQLTIPAGVTLRWEANIRGPGSPLMDLYGDGNFLVADGSIANTSTSSYTAVRVNGNITVTVTGGTVQAGLGTTIEGAGATTVTVSGGTVFSNATHNLSPVINMTNKNFTGTNVTVSGTGQIYANASGDTAYGYAIQTYGNIDINGGKVYTRGGYGRGLNLTGENSIATVSGGVVYATGVSGVAISTATTAGVDVRNTQVLVTGGLVYATTGMAIRTTGKDSQVSVSGGVVIAYGTGITGNGNVVFTQNNAALGFSDGKVTDPGLVIAWNRAAGRREYEKGTEVNIVSWPSGATAEWDNDNFNLPPGKDGIKYANGSNVGHLGFGDYLLTFDEVKVVTTPVVVPTYTITNFGLNAAYLHYLGADQSSVVVKQGDSVTFTMGPQTAATHYLSDVKVDGVSIGPVTSYTFTNVTANHQIFSYAESYNTLFSQIIAFAGAGGSFDQPGSLRITLGNDYTYTVKADPGFRIVDVRLNTNSVLEDTTHFTGYEDKYGNLTSGVYEFTNVGGNQWITATFERSMHEIDITHNNGGSVSLGETRIVAPQQIWVNRGDSVTFEIAVDKDYQLRRVLIDGVPAPGATSSFIQLHAVTADHDIVVEFGRDSGGRPPGVTGEHAVGEHRAPGDKDVSHLLDVLIHKGYIRGVGQDLFEPDRGITRAEIAQMFFNLLIEQNVEITKSFPDVPSGVWHEKAVHTLASLGIITGYPSGAFQPNARITRAEFIAIGVRFAKEMPGVDKDLPFNDVPMSHWAYKYIDAAVQYGWITGYGDGRIEPDRQISRAEAVTIVNRMLHRIADKAYINNHPELRRFSDVPEAYWAFYDIMEAYESHDYTKHGDAEEWIEIENP